MYNDLLEVSDKKTASFHKNWSSVDSSSSVILRWLILLQSISICKTMGKLSILNGESKCDFLTLPNDKIFKLVHTESICRQQIKGNWPKRRNLSLIK